MMFLTFGGFRAPLFVHVAQGDGYRDDADLSASLFRAMAADAKRPYATRNGQLLGQQLGTIRKLVAINLVLGDHHCSGRLDRPLLVTITSLYPRANREGLTSSS